MAEASELPPLPTITPQKIKRLIVMLASTNATPEARDFREKFEKAKNEAHNYANLRNIHPEFRGVFTPYIMSIEYILHDPRVKKIHASYYPYLNEAKRLEDACAALFVDTDVMNDLDKGKLFEPEVQKKLTTILEEKQTPQTEKTIEEVISEALKKKVEEKKKADFGSVKIKAAAEKKEEEPEKAKSAIVIPPPPIPVTAKKPVNSWRFRIRQVIAKIAPPLKSVAKKMSHAGFMFYKKHPVTARSAISGLIGSIAGSVAGWPGSPFTGLIAGVAAPYVAQRAFEVISPPPRPEPEEPVSYGQGMVRPGAYSVPGNSYSGNGQGMVRPGAYAPTYSSGIGQGSARPSRNMGNMFRNVNNAAKTARNLRTALTAVRGLAMLSNPVVLIIVIILLLILLFIFMFIILPTTSLLPPGQTDPTTTPTGQNFTIKKTGPTSVEKFSAGEKILYTITITYTGSGIGSANVTDTLPTDTTHSQSTPPGEVSGGTVKWTVTGLVPQQPKTITLEVTVNKDMANLWVVNSVNAVGIGASGNTGVGGVCPNPEEISANRADRNTCKGFNAAIQLLGATVSEAQIQKYIADNAGRSRQSVAEFERKTRFIVEKSMQSGINPVIIMGLWKTESGFTNSFGCDPHGGAFPTFEDQVECATGIRPGGAIAIQCAVTKDPNSKPCIAASQIVNSPRNAHVYYEPHKPNIPITTFDDFMKLYGPFSPKLGDSADGLNNNCIHSYNTLVEFAIDIGACNPTSAGGDAVTAGALASCKFYRNDQQGADCPPSDQGFRCEQAVEFKSPLLLSYINEASKKTGVPPEVLAAFVRVESTVPLKYSATKKSYSISDYTDADVQQMKNPISTNGDIDATIGNTNKAMCPRSTTGALGIMQIQPPQQVHDAVIASIQANNAKRSTKYTVPDPGQPDKSTPGNIDDAARAIGKTKATLTVDDFCDPQKSIIMASHVFFGKMGMTSWNPPQDTAGYERFINELARLYYGDDAQTGAYGNSVWRSVSSCKPTS